MIAGHRPAPPARTVVPTPERTVATTGQWTFPVESPFVAAAAEEATFLAGDYLVIEVEPVDGEFVATDSRTGMYGEGDTEQEALRSILASLENLRQELRADAGRLSPELEADLKYLDRVLWG